MYYVIVQVVNLNISASLRKRHHKAYFAWFKQSRRSGCKKCSIAYMDRVLRNSGKCTQNSVLPS